MNAFFEGHTFDMIEPKSGYFEAYRYSLESIQQIAKELAVAGNPPRNSNWPQDILAPNGDSLPFAEHLMQLLSLSLSLTKRLVM